MENKTYVLNRETGKIELYFEKSEYDALSDDQRGSLRSGYLWSRAKKAWVSRAKFPNLYGAKRVAQELGFTEEEKVGERLTYEEQLERKKERAEARAERYEGYAENAQKRAKTLTKEFEHFSKDIAFVTQPIIPGHAGSEAFARRRRQIAERFEKGMQENRKSDYFKERAKIARETAESAELGNPSYLNNRIKECTASIRKLQKNLDAYDEILNKLKAPDDGNTTYKGRYSEEQVQKWQEDTLERIEIQVDKLGFFQNCMDEIGGYRFSQENIKPGYLVKMRGYGKYKILKANPTTVYARSETTDMVHSFYYADIESIISDQAETPREDTELHPYEKDDILVWDPHGSGRYLAAYQVVAVTEKTVQMREIEFDSDGQPEKNNFKKEARVIRRKPYINLITNQWGICGAGQRILRKLAKKEDDENAESDI